MTRTPKATPTEIKRPIWREILPRTRTERQRFTARYLCLPLAVVVEATSPGVVIVRAVLGWTPPKSERLFSVGSSASLDAQLVIAKAWAEGEADRLAGER